MGQVFYRHIDPSPMSYTELRYFHEWHDVIAETELAKARALQG